MSKLLDESWKHWTKENYDLGVSPSKIFDILAKNNFDLNDIEKELNTLQSESPKGSTKKVNRKSTSIGRTTSTHIEGSTKVEVKNDLLEIYSIKNFLTDNECDELVKIIKENKVKSEVSTANKADGYIDDSVRTSSTCNLAAHQSDVVKVVDDKILECIGIHHTRGEAIQGQHYDKTQQFKQHTDTFHPNSEEYDLHCKGKGGQRTWTFMIYLNETEEGGETKFNNIKTPSDDEIVFKPEKGTAVVWNNLNPDGSPNHYSLHQGCPVVSGEKTIITKWFREQKL